MKYIAAVIMLLFVINSNAHKQIVVIPIGENPQVSKCSIVGVGVDCIVTGTVRVPVNLSFDCTSDGSVELDIHYTDTGNKVIFEIGVSANPKIRIRNFYFFPVASGVAISDQPSDNALTIADTSLVCATPTFAQIFYQANFIAAGKEWRIIPIFSLTEAPFTVESLIFVQVL